MDHQPIRRPTPGEDGGEIPSHGFFCQRRVTRVKGIRGRGGVVGSISHMEHPHLTQGQGAKLVASGNCDAHDKISSKPSAPSGRSPRVAALRGADGQCRGAWLRKCPSTYSWPQWESRSLKREGERHQRDQLGKLCGADEEFGSAIRPSSSDVFFLFCCQAKEAIHRIGASDRKCGESQTRWLLKPLVLQYHLT